MTTFRVDIPGNKIATFKAILEEMGLEYREEEDFSIELTNEQKEILTKLDELPRSDYITKEQFFRDLRIDYDL